MMGKIPESKKHELMQIVNELIDDRNTVHRWLWFKTPRTKARMMMMQIRLKKLREDIFKL